jgi:hypothetical protein
MVWVTRDNQPVVEALDMAGQDMVDTDESS